jgi:hypothetical protein
MLLAALCALYVTPVLGNKANETPTTKRVAVYIPHRSSFGNYSYIMTEALQRQGYNAPEFYVDWCDGDDSTGCCRMETFKALLLSGANLWYCGHGHARGLQVEVYSTKARAEDRLRELMEARAPDGKALWPERWVRYKIHNWESSLGHPFQVYGISVTSEAITDWSAEGYQRQIVYQATCDSFERTDTWSAGLAVGFRGVTNGRDNWNRVAMELFGYMSPVGSSRTDLRCSGDALRSIDLAKYRCTIGGRFFENMVLAPTVRSVKTDVR